MTPLYLIHKRDISFVSLPVYAPHHFGKPSIEGIAHFISCLKDVFASKPYLLLFLDQAHDEPFNLIVQVVVQIIRERIQLYIVAEMVIIAIFSQLNFRSQCKPQPFLTELVVII